MPNEQCTVSIHTVPHWSEWQGDEFQPKGGGWDTRIIVTTSSTETELGKWTGTIIQFPWATILPPILEAWAQWLAPYQVQAWDRAWKWWHAWSICGGLCQTHWCIKQGATRQHFPQVHWRSEQGVLWTTWLFTLICHIQQEESSYPWRGKRTRSAPFFSWMPSAWLTGSLLQAKFSCC